MRMTLHVKAGAKVFVEVTPELDDGSTHLRWELKRHMANQSWDPTP
jgi:hypothetical protein